MTATPPIENDALIAHVQTALDGLLAPAMLEAFAARSERMLADDLDSVIDVAGLQHTLHQIVRSQHDDMKLNHMTELNLCWQMARRGGRDIRFEVCASERNERRVDFGLYDGDHTWLVELKNLNAPLIRKASDPMSERLRKQLNGAEPGSDLHLVYLFFKRPKPDTLHHVIDALREAWRAHPSPRDTQLIFVPPRAPRVAAWVAPARPDSGGRVIVYDHGAHLQQEKGLRIRASAGANGRPATPRMRLEEMFVKDNMLRRLQDAEQKFPMHANELTRVLVFHAGGWAPHERMQHHLRQVVHYYQHGRAAADDALATYYEHWTARWRFEPHHNIDACISLWGDFEDGRYEGSVLFGNDDVWAQLAG